MALLHVDRITKTLTEGFAVNDVSFTLEARQKLAIIGETGSGKTTLLKMIAGIIQPSSGTMLFEGERILGPDEQLLPGRPGIAYLGQHFELRNNYSVAEELERFSLMETADAQQLYSLCQIDSLLTRRTNELSGGERQRIALAKQLSTKPRLLLLDEPFSNLDYPHKNTMKTVVGRVSGQLDITCIMVSHEPADILPWANRILVLQNGRLVQDGTPETVYRQPLNTGVAELLGPYQLLGEKEAAVLTGVSVTRPGQRKLFIRPEQLQIAATRHHTLDATVTAIHFGGAFDWVHVKAGDQHLQFPANQHDLAVGENILLALAVGERWYL